MYRSNKTGGFKSVLTQQQSSNIGSKIDSGTACESNGKTQNPVRSTSRILNLFKKPVEETHEKVVKQSEPIKNEEEVPHNDEKSDDEENTVVPNINSDKIIFNVVIGKKSTRKHKKWDDDGTLEVTGKSAVLKDSEGNFVHRTSVNVQSLVEGFRMYIDNKEIEIVDRVSEVPTLNKNTIEIVQEPPLKKHKSLDIRPFKPVGSLKKGLQLTYEPLVMPPLKTKGWLEQDTVEKEEEVCVDSCLASVLRPHQRQGIVFLYECIMGIKAADYCGAILADEMGLGKTLQCITIIWTLLKKGPYRKPVLKHVLIVTPSSLCNNWNKEFKHWLGYHRTCPYVVDAKNKPKDFKKLARNSIMIISYDMLIRCQEDIEQIDFDLVICDEGHRLKNNDIKAAKLLHNLNCKRRILLSGTPIQNDLQEFFSLIDFVNPGILGTNLEFKSVYENPIVASRCPHASADAILLGKERALELHERTKCFILRRTQDTINKYLPSKYDIVVFCQLSEEQENLYSLVTDAWFSKSVIPSTNVPHLTVITALKKICNHPELFNKDKNNILGKDAINQNKVHSRSSTEKEYCGKFTIVRTLMKNLKNSDEKLVLISYFTQTLDLLETLCNEMNLELVRLDGSTSSNLRSRIVNQFNSKTDSSKVFLLSAKAGGVGLNLPGASRLVLFDSDWNPASDAQAMARIWREGQKKSVYIYRLLTTGTIEEKIFQRQISKAGLSETIVDLNNFSSLKLSTSELKDLFSLSTHTLCLTHDLMKCSCNGEKTVDIAGELEVEKTREYQLVLEEKSPQQNLTINQLLEWEHYKQPVPDSIMQDIMLSEISDKVTFLFKNSSSR